MHLVRQFVSELMRCVLSCRVVPPDLSLGTSKRVRMLPRLVRILSDAVLLRDRPRIDCSPPSRSRPEGLLQRAQLRAFSRTVVLPESGSGRRSVD